MTNDEILSTYLTGHSRADCYRAGFRSAVSVVLNWGFATGDIDVQLMRHLETLTKPLQNTNETQTEQDTD